MIQTLEFYKRTLLEVFNPKVIVSKLRFFNL